MSQGLQTLPVAAALSLIVACAPAPVPPKVNLIAASVVPVQVVEELTLVSVTVNRSSQAAVFIVDTGASWTIISSLLATRLELSVPTQAVRRELRVVGGQVIKVPFVRLGKLQVGEAVVEELEVGVYDIAPSARFIDGLLGGNFLNRFNVTLDRQTGRMFLEPVSSDHRR
jgi:predicted aspartyl protease